MQTLDEKPETIHLYVVREVEPKPPILPIVLSALSLTVLLAFCVLIPYRQPEVRAVIRVPAVPLYLKDFQVSIQIVPTGVKTYPATTAHGVLTITNGSIIGQNIPVGFSIHGVVTDSAVYVPGGNANGYGWAQVSAHAGISGKNGNIRAYTINSVIGSSVYIRNLSAFYGGRDAYSVKFVTSKDRELALSNIRNTLTSKISGLHYPCSENLLGTGTKMVVIWKCQFVTYSAPTYLHVVSVKLSGKEILISGWFIPHPKRYWVK